MNNEREAIINSGSNEGYHENDDDKVVCSHFDGGDDTVDIKSIIDVVGSSPASALQKNHTVATISAAAFKAMNEHQPT